MSSHVETDFQRRLQAGAEAIELLDRVGFNVHEVDIEDIEADDCTFSVEATLSIAEMARPLQALEDETPTDSPVFALGLMAGVFLAGGCPSDGCGFDPETGTCTREDCSMGE